MDSILDGIGNIVGARAGSPSLNVSPFAELA